MARLWLKVNEALVTQLFIGSKTKFGIDSRMFIALIYRINVQNIIYITSVHAYKWIA